MTHITTISLTSYSCDVHGLGQVLELHFELQVDIFHHRGPTAQLWALNFPKWETRFMGDLQLQ